MSADHGALYLSLLAVLEHHEQSLSRIQAESPEETDVVHGMLARLVVHFVDWPVADLPDPCEMTTFLRRLCSFRLPDSGSLKLYHEELLTRHPGRGDLASLLRAVLASHEERCEGLSRTLPQLHGPLASALRLCLSLEMPGARDDELRGLEDPAVLAFAFGTGRKIGAARRLPALVGPSCETPGRTNCGLASAVAALLALRPMPVFAQWEVADALLHGSEGCPPDAAAGYLDWDFARYPLAEEYGGCRVYKSVPAWPAARRREGHSLEDLGSSTELVGRHYLSTQGVMQQFLDLWRRRPELAPASIVVVGFPDHVGRCAAIVRAATGMAEDRVVCLPARCYPAWDEHGCNAVTGYDPESTQPWTTSRARFLGKELCIRLGMGISMATSAAS